MLQAGGQLVTGLLLLPPPATRSPLTARSLHPSLCPEPI